MIDNNGKAMVLVAYLGPNSLPADGLSGLKKGKEIIDFLDGI